MFTGWGEGGGSRTERGEGWMEGAQIWREREREKKRERERERERERNGKIGQGMEG